MPYGDANQIITLSELAADPSNAASLPVATRDKLITRLAALILALTATAEPEAPRAEEIKDAPAQEFERLLNAKEAARMLGFAPSYIYELARRGALASVRHGKYVRFRVSTLRRFVSRNEQGLTGN
jgi:excisionase family DNA binding protein